VDFGIIQKVHPALILGIPYVDTGGPFTGIIPHPTATRGLLDK
jgi:hypothetical protein